MKPLANHMHSQILDATTSLPHVYSEKRHHSCMTFMPIVVTWLSPWWLIRQASCAPWMEAPAVLHQVSASACWRDSPELPGCWCCWPSAPQPCQPWLIHPSHCPVLLLPSLSCHPSCAPPLCVSLSHARLRDHPPPPVKITQHPTRRRSALCHKGV